MPVAVEKFGAGGEKVERLCGGVRTWELFWFYARSDPLLVALLPLLVLVVEVVQVVREGG